MAIYNVQLSNSETTICQAGVAETRAVLSILFCNTDTTARTLTLYCYPTGGSANATSTIISALSIPAGDTYIWSGSEKFILAPSDKISGLSDVASKISACANYMVL